jgi:hypothetical protein
MNPKNLKQKVAVGIVSGFGGIDKFHFNTIPESWLKVDVKEVMSPNADLMYPNENGDQHLVKDVVGGNTWPLDNHNRHCQLPLLMAVVLCS